MNFLRRLKFYGFGFGMGLMVVYALFGTRSCTTPNQIKVAELRSQDFVLSDLAKCKLKCLRKNEALLKLELRHFEVNYGASQVHKDPCGEYFLEPKPEHASEYNYRLIIVDCDTISRVNDLSIPATLTCNCN